MEETFNVGNPTKENIDLLLKIWFFILQPQLK